MHNSASIKLDLNELQGCGPLLRKSKLQPGDVLLVRGNNPFSSLIVMMSGGQYSHAAIWIPVGNADFTDLFLAESDTAGVGFTSIIPMSLYQEGLSTSETVYCIPDNPKNWVLLRHPECKNIDAAQMLQASIQLQKNDFFKTYSAVPRLLEAVTLPTPYHILFKGLAQTVECFRIDKGTRGAFCSELVATFFSTLGLDLFSNDRPPNTVAPNDFLLPECCLKVVADAFVDTDTLPPGTYGYGSIVQARKDDPYLSEMIKSRGVSDQLSATVDSLKSNLREVHARLTERQNKQATIIENQFMQSIEKAEKWGDSSEVDKLQRYVTMYKYGNRLLLCSDEYDKRLRNVEPPSEDIVSWNNANATLHYIAIEMMSCSQNALIRIEIISGLRRIRKTHSNSKPSILELVKFRRYRVKILKDWQKRKHECYEVRDFQKRLLVKGMLSKQAQAYMRDVAQITCQCLINDFAP
ncbi:hypothetical protein SOV92_19120 [Pectobacterium brasiliense]|uniref:Permuted papain-like amidase enzyme, YaeF/YiiX, C92 family n=1 Tax=Pectobacterium brasiliense TaxID=180957 RepID=A0AAW9HF40_9GAMM|nr:MULTISPECIES: hypothetical protein [Pectobacterium]MDY4379902.1 hypothetical protein [Pectobacterium brasiliense]